MTGKKYPNSPFTLWPQDEAPYPNRLGYNDHMYPTWVPVLTASDIVRLEDISRDLCRVSPPPPKKSISGWIERVFFSPGALSCVEEVGSYFIAACHELGFPARPHCQNLDYLTWDGGEGYEYFLSLDQIAAAWNRAMQKLGYTHEADRTAKRWEKENRHVPAVLWAKLYPKAKDRPPCFQRGTR